MLRRLTSYKRIVFFTGAGMSAESGVPTFRGKGGIWKKYDYKSYATQRAFDRAPEKVWDFHNLRRDAVAQCTPNKGHRLIAELESKHPHVMVITQNIDGLHQLAGTRNIIELHGNLWRTRCESCDRIQESREAPLIDLRCECGAYRRPDIVWFGDSLPKHEFNAATREMKRCNLVVSVGTSGLVHPAAELPVLAKKSGATLVEINPETTETSKFFHHRLQGTATEMLTQLIG